MYNGILWDQAPWPCPGEDQAPYGLNELLELQKCDWSPSLAGGAGQGLRPLPEKFPNAWCRCAPFTVQPASPDVTQDSGLFMGAGQEGNTSTKQHSPWLESPRAQAPRVKSRHRASLTVLGPLI